MADFENKNNAQWNENGAAQNADNTTNNSGAANTAAPAGNAGSGVNGAANPYAYQNGYYRNTTPHQDEAVHSGAYQQQNAAGSAYNNPAGGQNSVLVWKADAGGLRCPGLGGVAGEKVSAQSRNGSDLLRWKYRQSCFGPVYAGLRGNDGYDDREWPAAPSTS